MKVLSHRQSVDGFRKGTSLVELLAAMGILSILVYVLSAMLSVSLISFRDGTDANESSSGVRLALEWMERDLEVHCSVRASNVPKLASKIRPIQREFFESRIFLPFEIDRGEGAGSEWQRSFANAAPEFSSLAFAVESERYSGGGTIALVGYYVAFARDESMSRQVGSGMKLFRHFRPGGHPSAEGYADGILRYVSAQINDAWAETPEREALPLEAKHLGAMWEGRFENREFPFLFSRRFVSALDARNVKVSRVRSIVQPWPSGAISEKLNAVPPSLQPSHGTSEDWTDPENPIHEIVFSDDVVCERIVRFEVTPFRRVELKGGKTRLMSARELNQYLGFSQGDEWPALIAPDVMDLIIGTISQEGAASLTRSEDWIIDWSKVELGVLTPTEKRIVRNYREKRVRLALPRRIR